jgi:pyrimidine operon attenuation protein/uracil phosphoribosyltransferase
MSKGKTILKEGKFRLTLERLAQQLIEEHGDFDNTCIIGIQEKGVELAERILELINIKNKKNKLQFGKLDTTFYRDDFRTHGKPLRASNTDIEFILDNKHVILVDDVLYTGRTILSALAALQDFGRPSNVQLLVMVDRRFYRNCGRFCR